jgi:hypothetical protein
MNIFQVFRRIGQQMGGWAYSLKMLNAQMPLIKKIYARHGMEIVMTCGACPEQYEVFKDGSQVAYFRLRHGEFTVTYPDASGEEIFSVEPNGDGTFDENERLIYLTIAKRAILAKIKETSQ